MHSVTNIRIQKWSCMFITCNLNYCRGNSNFLEWRLCFNTGLHYMQGHFQLLICFEIVSVASVFLVPSRTFAVAVGRQTSDSVLTVSSTLASNFTRFISTAGPVWYLPVGWKVSRCTAFASVSLYTVCYALKSFAGTVHTVCRMFSLVVGSGVTLAGIYMAILYVCPSHTLRQQQTSGCSLLSLLGPV